MNKTNKPKRVLEDESDKEVPPVLSLKKKKPQEPPSAADPPQPKQKPIPVEEDEIVEVEGTPHGPPSPERDPEQEHEEEEVRIYQCHYEGGEKAGCYYTYPGLVWLTKA